MDGTNGVLLVTDEPATGAVRVMLDHVLSRFGWAWSDFSLASASSCAPSPRWAVAAARTCSHFDTIVNTTKPHAFLAVGERAFERLVGQRVSPLLARGYVWPEVQGRGWVVAALPPLYYRQDPGMLLTFLSDAGKALRIAEHGFAYDETIRPVWNPTQGEWDAYVRDFLDDPTRPLAADIETPYKRLADMTEAERSGPDLTYTIDEVNLSYDGTTGVSVPFTDAFRPGILAMLQASQAAGVTLFWNAPYDIPRLEANLPITFSGEHTRDVMDTFRVWRNTVRRKLVVATSLLPSCWNVRPWKHLGSGDPFYRAMDVVSLWRNDADLLALLAAEGQMGAYRRFVSLRRPVSLSVDPSRLSALADSLDARLVSLRDQMTALVPEAILPRKVYKTRKAAEKGRATMVAKGEIGAETQIEEREERCQDVERT